VNHAKLAFLSKRIAIMTHAELAARLLRDAAAFFRQLAKENPSLDESMGENAAIYEQVAQMVETAPLERIMLEDAEPSKKVS
jgi:hypothetical protein